MRRRRRIDPTLDRPRYKQVADDLREQIRDGSVRPGEMLPGEARLAAMYDVGTNSIRAALHILRAERLIVTEQGVGSRVSEPEEAHVSVHVPAGASITIRPASDSERRRWGLAPHEPVAVIETLDGRSQIVPAYRCVLRTGEEGDSGRG